jgi:uncharacterized protein YndB with AHSA1/START domain
MSDSEIEIGMNQLSIKRTFDAPITRLFACFTQPELLVQWHSPSDSMTVDALVDLQPGGSYRIGMTGEDGQAHIAVGQFREIDEPYRLVYSWRWEGGEGQDTLVTVLFSELGAQTEVELIHTGFDSDDTTQHHSQGWMGIFSRLAIHLA